MEVKSRDGDTLNDDLRLINWRLREIGNKLL